MKAHFHNQTFKKVSPPLSRPARMTFGTKLVTTLPPIIVVLVLGDTTVHMPWHYSRPHHTSTHTPFILYPHELIVLQSLHYPSTCGIKLVLSRSLHLLQSRRRSHERALLAKPRT
jgi:hypothetical protein